MSIVYQKADKELFLNYWNEYVDNNISSYRYLNSYLMYMEYYTSNLLANESFVIIENGKCVGICFLPIEKYDNIISISLAQGYTISPLSIDSRINKFIFKEIENIVNLFNVDKVQFYVDSLLMEYENKYNFLLEYGFLDTSASNCILDLKQDTSILWKNLRKSYKSLINGILKNSQYEIVIISKKNKDHSIHEEYRKLHKKAAGKETRSKETFDKQYELLENDKATIIGLRFNNKFIGLNYFLHHQKTVVYYSGADDPEYTNKNIPIYHSILWEATKYFKNLNFDFIEYSQPSSYNIVDGFANYSDKKQINIAHFKRGMGTKMVPLFRGVKYYNKKLLLEDINEFKKRVENINV